MISPDKRGNFLFWVFIMMLVVNNIMIMPSLAMLWVGLVGVLVGMSWVSRKISSLAVCVGWGTIGGFICLWSFFILIREEQTHYATLTLMGAFILWMLLLLTEKKEKSRWWIFHLLGPVQTAVQVLILTGIEAPISMFLMVLAQTGVYMAIAFKHTTESNQGSEPPVRWVAMVMVGAMALSAPIILGKELINREVSFPSIGKLPSISTSNEMVMLAQFHGVPPIGQTYWETRDIYAIPGLHGQWDSIAGYEIPNRDKDQPHLVHDDHVSTVRVGTSKIIHKHTVMGRSLGFSMPGTIPSTTRTDAGMSAVGRGNDGAYDLTGTRFMDREAWALYEDKILEGFSEQLDAMYLSIPYGDFDPAKGVDLEGARIGMPRTWEMVQKWKAEGLTDEQFIERTLKYFEENLAYHFDHQSEKPEENELDWFLFTDKKGVCRHFANAFGLIMRMGGIRSRIRGGLYGGEIDLEKHTGYSVIRLRKRDAHAWNEVWLDGKGWVMIDPTGVVPVEKGVPEDNSLGGLMAKFANINFMEQFNTAGSAGQVEEGTRVQAALDKIRSALLTLTTESLKAIFLIAMGLVGVIVALWWGIGAMKRWRDEDPCDRQWRLLVGQLTKWGVVIAKNNGPRTIGKKVEELLTQEEGQAWMKDVLDYERYKYGQEPSPGLAERLRKWRKTIKQTKKDGGGPIDIPTKSSLD